MNQRYCIRLFRMYVMILTICILFLWLIPSIIFNLDKKNVDTIIDYNNFLDNHIYPPPWYISNWTINDYFIRKDYFKNIEDQYSINNNEKIVVEYDFFNQKKEKKSDYIILEYTNVFKQPKFCGKTQDFIFGKQCPYKNCR